jgi:glycosyltransferase involved in cell wall biosynthesis
MSHSKKLLFFVTEDWYFCSHRLPLALAAKKAGYEIVVVTRVRSHGNLIKKAGCKLIPLELSRRGMNPVKEFLVICRLYQIYKAEKPSIVHHVALKPVLYGSIASLLAKVTVTVNAMAGLGFLKSTNFIKARLIHASIMPLLRILLNRQGCCTIFQNPDDLDFVCNLSMLDDARVALIRGSGVDIREYDMIPESNDTPVVVLASRLLWSKGVGEFVEAALKLKNQGVLARFVLVGEGDVENPETISTNQLKKWHEQNVVEWWGWKDNMPKILAESHIVCLPSTYGEGVPKVLIEAAACGRPIVTTDSPGCREIVKDGLNGFLVPLRDAVAVSEALSKLIKAPCLRMEMGVQGRKMVEREFSLEKVNMKL